MNNSVLNLIGNTPVVKINNIKKNKNKNINVYAKLESFNPGGSIKDRIAAKMIEKAEQEKKLNRKKTIIEASSGNTAIGLALVSKIKGYNFTAVMSKSVSEERRKILRSYGASIILTSKKEKTDGAIRLVNKLVEKHPERFYNPNQFSNKYNYLTHYYSTGPELWKQLNGNIDYFIAGIGTSGTIRGVGKYLKEKNKNIKIIGVLPEKEHGIQGLKNLEESIIPDIYNDKIIDIFINVNTEKSYKNARDLSKTEGIFAGMSSGASFLGVKKLIKEIDRGNVATIFPDGGEKYLSTNLYQNKSNSGKRASI